MRVIAYVLPWPAAFCGLLVGVGLGAGLVTCLGLALFGFTAAWYLEALGEDVAIVPLAGVISSAQWILGPVISYRIGDPYSKYRMYVPEAEYMSFVVPALFAFVLALAWIAPRIPIYFLQSQILINRAISERVIIGLILVGLLADYFSDESPAGLGFVLFLIAQFKYIGAIYMVIFRWRYRWWAVSGLMLLTAITSARIGMFHDLILWAAMIFTFLCFDFRLRIWSKLAIIIVFIGVLSALQSVKSEYRSLLQENPDVAGLKTLLSSVGEAFVHEIQRTEAAENSVRLNQGWIISAVMANTPSSEPFADGETVIDAVQDSLLPRFLVAKREAIVSNNFRRFTGLSVGQSTSFGISIVGEAWANFGRFGIALLFMWGALFGGIVRLIAHRSIRQPTFALWIPLIFLYAVKAETELVVALNHMFKAGIFVVILYAFTWRILKIRI